MGIDSNDYGLLFNYGANLFQILIFILTPPATSASAPLPLQGIRHSRQP